MAWIESHQALREHPKVYRLMDLLGISKLDVIGHLHLLWWWCVDYAPDGLLHYSPLQIARAAEWTGSVNSRSSLLVNGTKGPVLLHRIGETAGLPGTKCPATKAR